MTLTSRNFFVSVLVLALALGLAFLIASARPAMAEPVSVTPLPPVEMVDGRAGACYSNYYEHGNRPFLPLVHAAGVRYDRVDFIWAAIEPENDVWNFAPYDELVADTLAEGVDFVVILQWTPDWAAAGGRFGKAAAPPQRPPGWYAPEPRTQALDVPISPSAWSSVPEGLYLSWDDPDNRWGDFVFQTVSRYRGAVSVWEMWNEPDGNWGVWDGSAADYARLLKVGYQAAKAADPSATVLFGGLMYWANPAFFEDVLAVLSEDPDAPANNYFFDVMSVHFYSRSSDAFDMVNSIRDRMEVHVSPHPIWLTETGVPVYDGEYPGVRSEFAATEVEAAAYLLQSYANAIAARVERYHWFRPHDADMAEHFGLTHDENYIRPAYVAYQVATTYLISPTFTTRVAADSQVRVTLWGTPRGKVSVLWNESPATSVYTVPAAIDDAVLVDARGITEAISATSGVYTVTLAGATASRASDPNDYIIGGAPVIVVETETPNAPPTSTVHPLPEITFSSDFTVTWEGKDNHSGVWIYDVQVRDGEDGEWTYWQHSTASTSGLFNGQHGHIYYFRSRATDRVGNRGSWPAEPQAHTTLDYMATLTLSIGGFFADENRNDIWDQPITATGDITLASVQLAFRDDAVQDVVSPTVGSTWVFTTTVLTGQFHQLWAISGDYMRVLSLIPPVGEKVYTYTREYLGLWPVTRVYLPLTLRTET